LLSNISGLLSEHKNLIHYNQVKKVITSTQTAPSSESYFACPLRPTEKIQTCKGQQQVVVFVAGGGSYYEYHLMHKLQEELGV